MTTPLSPFPNRRVIARSVDIWSLEIFALRAGRWRRMRSIERRLRGQSIYLSNTAALQQALAALAAQLGYPLRAVETPALADPAHEPPALCVEREDTEGFLHFDFPLTARLIGMARDAAARREPFNPGYELDRLTLFRSATYRIVYKPDLPTRAGWLDPRHADKLPAS